MLKMIERLLELSKLKRYDFELHKSEVNLRLLIEEVCDSMHYKAKRYNLDFHLELENVFCLVDPDLIKQVIINIIDNSIKYSHSPKVDISLKKQKNVILTITDYGTGIDVKSLANLFEPYYKADKSRNSQIEGWGLGLSIAREIIQKHSGQIEIQSAIDAGTQVKITL